MPAKKQDGLPPGIRKRSTARAPGFVYEVFFYSPIFGDRSERVGTDLRAAKRRLADLRRDVQEGAYRPQDEGRATTIEERARIWLAARTDVRTHDNDVRRFEMHILPTLGAMRVEHVQTKHIVSLIETLRAKKGPKGKPLAKNTIRNIYANVTAFFAHLEQQEAITRNPCKGLATHQRPKKARRAEVQRGFYEEAEVAQLVSDERIPLDRRVVYALLLLTGARFGEVAGLRWSDVHRERTPLGLLRVERQYEGLPLKGPRNEPGPPRDVPIHPLLAAILDRWYREGFASFFGRDPQPHDSIVPSREGRIRSVNHAGNKLADDCKRLGIAYRSIHTMRNTFATLAIAGGAPEAWVRRITHNASGDVIAGYTVNHWPAMCDAVRRIVVPVEPGTLGASVAPALPERVEPANVIVLADVLANRARIVESIQNLGAERAGWTGLEGRSDLTSGLENGPIPQVGDLVLPVENRAGSGSAGVDLAQARTMAEAVRVLLDAGRPDLAAAVLHVIAQRA